MTLTQRQQQILDFIASMAPPPTIRQIGARFGIRSTNAVSDHLKALMRKGWLTRDGGKLQPTKPRVGLATVPILGRASAGEPVLSESEALGRVVLDGFFVGEGAVFALKSVGDAMVDAGIIDGDYLFVRREAEPVTGDVVVLRLEGAAVALRYFPEQDRIRFQPDNLRHRPVYVNRCDFKQGDILGVVVGVFRHTRR